LDSWGADLRNSDYDVEYFAKTGIKIPPPQKRLCKKHKRPITPHQWLNRHRTTQCSKCLNEKTTAPKARERRLRKYNEEDIRCINHPKQKAKRSEYVRQAERLCNWCHDHRSDNSVRPARKRVGARYRRKWRDRKRMQRATTQPFNRKPIAEILRMRTGFKTL
jgi:hypothetical protein